MRTPLAVGRSRARHRRRRRRRCATGTRARSPGEIRAGEAINRPSKGSRRSTQGCRLAITEKLPASLRKASRRSQSAPKARAASIAARSIAVRCRSSSRMARSHSVLVLCSRRPPRQTIRLPCSEDTTPLAIAVAGGGRRHSVAIRVNYLGASWNCRSR